MINLAQIRAIMKKKQVVSVIYGKCYLQQNYLSFVVIAIVIMAN